MPTREDFADTFERLKKIIQKHAARLVVVHDQPGNYYLN